MSKIYQGRNLFYLADTYQWIKPLEDNFNWYYGFGAGIGRWDKSAVFAGLGQLGIEYNFGIIPLQLSFDWRPGISFVFNNDIDAGFWAGSFGLGVRYKF